MGSLLALRLDDPFTFPSDESCSKQADVAYSANRGWVGKGNPLWPPHKFNFVFLDDSDLIVDVVHVDRLPLDQKNLPQCISLAKNC